MPEETIDMLQVQNGGVDVHMNSASGWLAVEP
ncbi:MAG: hypothetical protein FD146_1331 [Anaerolineaceae bacterium]|nr:MAG: hypothetical protein FD146_1331 [Anaerolineaceae bacterium]